MASPVVFRLRVLGAAFLFSTGGAAVKACTLTAWQVASFRSGIAAAAVFLMSPPARRQWTWRVWLVGIVYAATLVLFVRANKLTTAANATFLQATAPLYVLLLGPLLLREPIRRRDLLFMAALGGGLLLLFGGRDPAALTAPNPGLGNVFAAVTGLTWALTVVGLRWISRAEARPDTANTAPVIAGNLTAFLVCLPFALPVTDMEARNWMVVSYLGFVQVGFAYILLTGALQHVPALEASLLLLVEPVLSPVWAWYLHGERPGGWSMAGGAVIVAATAVKTWHDTARRAPPGAASASRSASGLS